MTRIARRAAGTVALAAALGTLIAGCGDTPRTTPTTPTVTVTSTASASTPAPTTAQQPAGDATDPTTATGDVQNASTCDPDGVPADTVARDSATIVPPRDSRWVPDPDVGRGGDFWGGLSWVAVQGANSHFPARSRQLLIHHDGTFQGTAIRCEAFRGQEVSSVASDAIRVTTASSTCPSPSRTTNMIPSDARRSRSAGTVLGS